MAKRKYRPDLVLRKTSEWNRKRLTRRRKPSQSLALRARIVLLHAEGITRLEIAEKLGTSNVTVGKWRSVSLENESTVCWTNLVPGNLAKSAMRTSNA